MKEGKLGWETHWVFSRVHGVYAMLDLKWCLMRHLEQEGSSRACRGTVCATPISKYAQALLSPRWYQPKVPMYCKELSDRPPALATIQDVGEMDRISTEAKLSKTPTPLSQMARSTSKQIKTTILLTLLFFLPLEMATTYELAQRIYLNYRNWTKRRLPLQEQKGLSRQGSIHVLFLSVIAVLEDNPQI